MAKRKQVKEQFSLRVHLVPEPLHGENLRNLMGKHRWTKEVREPLLAAQKDPRCSICSARPERPSDLQAHEVWHYENRTKTIAVTWLDAINLICADCHRVQHFMHTVLMERERKYPPGTAAATVRHFCRVNKTTEAAFARHYAKSVAEMRRQSAFKWEIKYAKFTHLTPWWNEIKDFADRNDVPVEWLY